MILGKVRGTILLFCSLIAAPAIAQFHNGENLRRVLFEMGSHSVNLDGYMLDYSVDLEVPDVKYRRWVDLTKFDYETISPIRLQMNKGKKEYYFNVVRSDLFYEETIPYLNFETWVRKEHPNTRWPLELDENTKSIEDSLRIAVPNISEITRFEFDDEGQKRTVVELQRFTMGHDNRIEVEKFRRYFLAYANELGCVGAEA